MNTALINRLEQMTNSNLDDRLNYLCKRYIQDLNSLKCIKREETLLNRYREMNAVDNVLQLLLKELANRGQTKRLAIYQQRYEAILIKRYGE